jgi:hypothetical protein
MEYVKIRGGLMKVYRIYDKEQKKFIKIGKRTNDIYVNKKLLIKTLKTYYNLEQISDRFTIYEYELVLKKEGN